MSSFHWLYTLWYGYAWPSLKGNGPEAVIQTVVYAAAAIILIPVVRRFIRAELAVATGEVKKVEAELAKAEHWLLRLLKSPAKVVGALKRVRVTVTPKELAAVKDVGAVVDAVDPALEPVVHTVEGAVSSAAAQPPTTMSAR